MKEYQTDKIRNIALVSHNGAGKTTFVERLLFHTGKTTRMGSVQSGNAAMDFEQEEIDRHSSLSTAIAPIEWKNTKLNFLDTPGYIDFVGEVNSTLSVVDSAVVLVEAVSGVEVGTELVMQNCESRNLPRVIFVNKMDRDNVRTHRVMQSINEHLEGNFIPVQVPIGEGTSFEGVVDLISMKAYIGADNKVTDIPATMADDVEAAREALIEAAAEGDDALMEKYFEELTLSNEEIIRGLKGAMSQGLATPVFYGAGEPGVAIVPFLDTLVKLMPAPHEGMPQTAIDENENEMELKADDNGPLSIFVFKTRDDAYGKMSFIRVNSGVLSTNSRVWNANLHSEVRIGTIEMVTGKDTETVAKLHSGDIGMVVKLGDTGTNHTLTEKNTAHTLPAIEQPDPIASVSIHPESQSDVAKLSESLSRLIGEDPTLHYHTEKATRETILSGMGTTHLDIAVKKVKSKFGVSLTTSIPKVPYRETITKTASAEYTHKKQSGGAGQYGRVFLRVESIPDDEEFTFTSEIFGGAISAPFVAAVEKGCRQALDAGPLAGCPVVGVKAIVYDGKEHPVDSKEIAFQIAGRECFRKAALSAGPALLEPIYQIDVTVPTDNMGDIMGDMNTRRAKVLGMEQTNTKAVIMAEVPLAESQSYAADLRSMTQGRGVFSMKFLRYGRVPSHIQQQVIDERAKEREES